MVGICSNSSTNESCDSPLNVDDVRSQNDHAKLNITGDKAAKKEMKLSPEVGIEQDPSIAEKKVTKQASIEPVCARRSCD